MMAPVTPTAALAAYSAVTPAATRLLAERIGGCATETGGALLIEGPDPAASIFNLAFRVDPDARAASVLDAARARFEPRGFAYTVWSQAGRDQDIDQAAANSGWQRAVELPAMMIRQPLAERPVPGGTLRVVKDAVHRTSFAAIAAEALGSGDDDRRAYRALLIEPDLHRDGCRSFVAAIDGVDAAVAWVVVVGGVGLVGWVGTLPPYRRRGLGALVTTAASNAGFDMGAALVFLQASPQGRPVYAALGFEEITHETLWVRPGPDKTEPPKRA